MDTPTKKIHHITGDTCPIDLAGVNIKGIQYYDLGKVKSINSSGIADLIEIIKVWASQGAEVRFVNVSESIKKSLNDLGLENIFYMD